MTTFSYPSTEFPALPGVEVDVPDGWGPIYVPGTVLAVRAPLVPEQFAANAVVTINRYSLDFDLATALAGLRTDIGRYDGGKVDEPFEAEFGADRYVVVNAAFEHPEAGTLLQVHAFSSFAIGEMKDVVHVTGTCGAGQMSTDYPVLQQVLQTTRVRPAVPVA